MSAEEEIVGRDSRPEVKLRWLAAWFDRYDERRGAADRRAVQQDLLRWADEAEAGEPLT